MKLVYIKEHKDIKIGDLVKVGDVVRTGSRNQVTVEYFAPPHKPSSSGKVTVKHGKTGPSQEFYVCVIGAEWIEREDRIEQAVAPVIVNENWRLDMVERLGNDLGAALMFVNGQGKIMQIDVKVIARSRILMIEAENLVTGNPRRFSLEEDGMTVKLELPL